MPTPSTFATAAAQLRKECRFYTDPIMVAVADGFYAASEGKPCEVADYRGIVVGDGYFLNTAVRIGYERGVSQGRKRRAQRAKRGW